MINKELRRLLFNIPAIIIVITALIVSILFSYVTVHRVMRDNAHIDKYYKEYMDRFQGLLTKEKVESIQEEKSFIDDTISKEMEMLSLYNNGEIDSTKYQEYLNENFYAMQHSAAIDKVYEKCNTLLNNSEDKKLGKGHLIYDTYWELYFKMDFITFMQMIVIMALVIRYISGDYATGMWRMTQTYFNGKSRLLSIRLRGTILSCVTISLLYAMVYFLFFKHCYTLSDMNAPIQSIVSFNNLPLEISISKFVIILVIFKSIAFCLFGIFIFSVTSIIKNIVVSAVICGFVVLIPQLFATAADIFLKLSFYEMLLGVGVMSRSVDVRDILWMLLGFTGLSLATCILAWYMQSDARFGKSPFFCKFHY